MHRFSWYVFWSLTLLFIFESNGISQAQVSVPAKNGPTQVQIAAAIAKEASPSAVNRDDLKKPIERIGGGGKILSYHWIGSRDFLIFRDRQRLEAVRKNGHTGEETPLPGLSKILKESLGSPSDTNIVTGISADERWCLIWPLGGKKFVAATLDGAKQCSWERPQTFVSPRWLSQGHRWFLSQESAVIFAEAEGSQARLLLFDPDAPKVVEEIPVGGKLDPAVTTKPLGPYGEFNMIAKTNNDPHTAKGYLYDLNDKIASRRNLKLLVPEVMIKRGLVDIPRMAPDGNSLLWKIDEKEGAAASFHLTKLDGTNPILLTEFASPTQAKITFGLFDPQWSADGKKFAFLADGALHTVTVKGK